MANILKELLILLPHITFKDSEAFYWSPADQTVYYDTDTLKKDSGIWALIHEAAHAKLAHQTYTSDLELLMLEVAAWDEASNIGKRLGVAIDGEHIQDCLDTYRDWLHQRSTCPACGVVSLQESPTIYKCFNCTTSWRVSASRFCRPYRLSKYGAKKKTPPETVAQATFHKKVK